MDSVRTQHAPYELRQNVRRSRYVPLSVRESKTKCARTTKEEGVREHETEEATK